MGASLALKALAATSIVDVSVKYHQIKKVSGIQYSFQKQSVPAVVYDVQTVSPSTVSGGRSWQTSDGKTEFRIRHANCPYLLTVKIT